jgi:hypothetical protein
MSARHGQVEVSSLAKCKFCGDEQVAWIQGKTGKWYLATAYVINDGGTHTFVANKFDPHFTRCKAPIGGRTAAPSPHVAEQRHERYMGQIKSFLASTPNAVEEVIDIIWPEKRAVKASVILGWYRDAVANGEITTDGMVEPSDDIDARTAAELLMDAGKITLRRRDR